MPVRRTREAPNGEVETRRAELALIVAVGLEVDEARRCRDPRQHVRRSAIRDTVVAAAALVSQGTRVSQQADRQAGAYPSEALLVARQPGERPYRAGSEYEAPREPRPLAA